MTARRPLVIDSTGVKSELPSADTLLGVPSYLPAYSVTPTLLRIPIANDYTVEVFKAAGGSLLIGVETNG